MREFLFRGKANSEIRDGEWVYGSLLAESENTFPIIAQSYDNDEDWIGIDLWDTVEPATVGQYTGLTDKNGKKIFEGDIVKHYNDRKFPQSYQKGVIFYDDESLHWKRTFKNISCCLGNDCIYEVIGNIYDNPELLKEGEQL